MAVYGSIMLHVCVVVYGCIVWLCIAIYVWLCMVVYGCVYGRCTCVAMYGSVWLFTAGVWLCMAVDGCLRRVCGHVWQCMVVCDYDCDWSVQQSKA